MLGRRSTLIGAMVQAANVAIHSVMEKNPASKPGNAGNKGLSGNSDNKEVMLTRKRSATLQTSSLLE
jgi:hypothetical protein